jgi:GntR family transcriptional regulator, transcriptional repressor for pyruvate dehydrogenase complex
MATNPAPKSDSDDPTQLRADAWMGMERTEKIPELLARRILRQITQNGLQAGDRLPAEARMLEELGSGRASLREALRILEIHGVIRIKPGPQGGPRVTGLSASDLGQTMTLYLQRNGADFRDLVEARMTLEPVMAALAAKRLTAENADRIRHAVVVGWEAVDGSPDVWSDATQLFHTVVASASRNRVLDLQASSLISIERTRVGPVFGERTHRVQTLRVHDKIAEAILNGEETRASTLTRKHLQVVAKVMEDHFDQYLDEKITW